LLIFLALVLLSTNDPTGSARAQGLQGNENVSLNDSVPREVENVTVVQNLGDSVSLKLKLTLSPRF